MSGGGSRVGGGGEEQSGDSSGLGGGTQDTVSQREKCEHDHAPVLVCTVMNERAVPRWGRRGIFRVVFDATKYFPSVKSGRGQKHRKPFATFTIIASY